MNEDETWQRAENGISPVLFNTISLKPAQTMRRTDRRWFKERPGAIVRIRRIRRGESRLVAWALDGDPQAVAYLIILHHWRAQDRRKEAGIGYYPILLDRRDDVAEIARSEARAMLAWFTVSSEDYPHQGLRDERVLDLITALGVVQALTGKPWMPPSAAGEVAL